MTTPKQSKHKLAFCKRVAFFLLLFSSPIVFGDNSGMIYPDDFDAVPIEAYDSLSDAERVAYCIYWLEAEVNNGGFHQFFLNSSGLRTIETIRALDAIRAHKTKEILKRASEAAYESGFPADPTMHEELLKDDDETMDALDELDALFFAYEDDLSGLVNQFLTDSATH